MADRKRKPVWITPAHAGKSCNGSVIFTILRDHPRTCGEKCLMRKAQRQDLGSPPHMRGKAFDGSRSTPPAGITPAHAGKSFAAEGSNAAAGDHPRTCGEK